MSLHLLFAVSRRVGRDTRQGGRRSHGRRFVPPNGPEHFHGCKRRAGWQRVRVRGGENIADRRER
jgi:hypothetical protein